MVVIFIVNTTLVHHRVGQGWGGGEGRSNLLRKAFKLGSLAAAAHPQD